MEVHIAKLALEILGPVLICTAIVYLREDTGSLCIIIVTI